MYGPVWERNTLVNAPAAYTVPMVVEQTSRGERGLPRRSTAKKTPTGKQHRFLLVPAENRTVLQDRRERAMTRLHDTAVDGAQSVDGEDTCGGHGHSFSRCNRSWQGCRSGESKLAPARSPRLGICRPPWILRNGTRPVHNARIVHPAGAHTTAVTVPAVSSPTCPRESAHDGSSAACVEVAALNARTLIIL